MTDNGLSPEVIARRAVMDAEHGAAAAAVKEVAGRTSLVVVLGIELALRLQARFKVRTVADLDAFVTAYREKELREKDSGFNQAEAARVVRALGLWWEPRFLAALARVKGVERPEAEAPAPVKSKRPPKAKATPAAAPSAPAARQATLWSEDP